MPVTNNNQKRIPAININQPASTNGMPNVLNNIQNNSNSNQNAYHNQMIPNGQNIGPYNTNNYQTNNNRG